MSGATLSGAWLRFAQLDGARCQDTNFAGADLLFASMVKTDLRGANMTAVHVFGVPAWSIETDERTRYASIEALMSGLQRTIIDAAETRANQIAEALSRAAAALKGA